jgi:hypothetical protein
MRFDFGIPGTLYLFAVVPICTGEFRADLFHQAPTDAHRIRYPYYIPFRIDVPDRDRHHSGMTGAFPDHEIPRRA